MATRPPNPENDVAGPTGGSGPDAPPAPVVRRAPFSDNPHVGARGQRTQQRILDAALEVFGDDGYHRCSVARITEQAGCSRASFYQYFSSKEEVFQHLTGQVARQLTASIESLDPLTADVDGWASLRSWVARQAEIYERYEPVFHAFEAAAQTDEAVASGSARWAERSVARIRARLTSTDLPVRQLDPVISLLRSTVTRSYEMAGILQVAVPSHYEVPRINDALADIIHRTFFGVIEGVNVHEPPPDPPPVLQFDPAIRNVFTEAGRAGDLTSTGRQTLEALMSAGHDVFVARGYHRTRVDDVVAAAGVSHGAFYRYFESKDQLARVMAANAMQEVALVVGTLPTATDGEEVPGRAVLRRWLRKYNDTQANEAAMLRVWVDAAVQDAALRSNTAPALDWGRRNLAAFLRPRGFGGDVDVEALVMVALLSAYGARPRSPGEVDAAAYVIERALLGRPD